MDKWERYSLESLSRGESDQFGRLFMSPKGQRELHDVRILHAGVDTVRQLYRGSLCLSQVAEIVNVYEEGRGATMDLFGHVWAVGAGATGSGFRYRLQNNDLGVIVFFQARHTKIDAAGTHVKIELSPHFIHERSPSDCQAFMDNIAYRLMYGVEHSGCAVHLALDVQGWAPDDSFMPRFVTRSKRIMRIDGIDDISFDHGTIATTYGRCETLMFGTAGALQCSIYNKTKEALHRDKIHFWEQVWRNAVCDDLSPAYNPEQHVFRIEMRFHQSVMAEYGRGIPCNVDTGEVLDSSHAFASFVDTVPHLTGLWRSAMQSYRLDYSRGLIDPVWQLFLQDARFYAMEPGFLYKRARKSPGIGNEKNVALVVGNLISLYARQGFSTHQAMQGLQRCGAWDDIANYYRLRGLDSAQLRHLISQRLVERRLLGKAA